MLVILFLSYYLSATCFYHTHYYSWGTVTHSHFCFPFGDNPTPQHHHTQSQCQTIQLLSGIVLAFLVAAIILATGRNRRIYISVCRLKAQLHLVLSLLRAPPAN